MDPTTDGVGKGGALNVLKVSRQGTVAASMILTMGNVLTMALGYLFTLIIVWNFGASGSSDAYYLSLSACAFLSGLLNSGLMGSMIPAFAADGFQSLPTHERQRQWSSTLNLLLVLMVLLGGFVAIWAGSIVAFLGPGLAPETRVTATVLTRMLMPTIVLLPVVSFFTASLNALHHFSSRVMADAAAGLTGIVVALTFIGRNGIYAFGLAVPAGAAVQLLVLSVATYRAGFRYRPSAGFGAAGQRVVGALFIPLVLEAVLLSVRTQFVKSLATMAVPGSLTALSLGLQLADLPLGIVVSTFGSAVLPRLAKLWSQRETREFMAVVMTVLRMGLFLTIPAAAGIMMLGGPIIRAVFQRGAFDEAATHLTVLIVIFYVIGLPFRGACNVLGNALYATLDGWWQVLFSGSGVVTTIGIGLLLLPNLGTSGLAISLTLGNVITSALLLYFLHWRLAAHPDTEGAWFVAKTMGAALVMTAFVLPAHRIIGDLIGEASRLGNMLTIGLLILIGVWVYLAMGRLIRLREATMIRDLLVPRLARKL